MKCEICRSEEEEYFEVISDGSNSEENSERQVSKGDKGGRGAGSAKGESSKTLESTVIPRKVSNCRVESHAKSDFEDADFHDNFAQQIIAGRWRNRIGQLSRHDQSNMTAKHGRGADDGHSRMSVQSGKRAREVSTHEDTAGK